ncbi:ATP-binding protein [Myxococcus faecalis]|uniref:ATP-binding protein n=1 Tax=Myxococcus faecalis TaxID=3115646 RepID=UPI003CFA7F2E
MQAINSSSRPLSVTPQSTPSPPLRTERKHPGTSGAETDQQLGLEWLLRLRWGAVSGQLLVLSFVTLVAQVDLPYGLLYGLVGFTAASNAALALWGQPGLYTWRLPLVLTVDVVVLTVMLASTGGSSNPFTAFFIVHVALAALLLGPRLTWAMVAFTVVGYASLFLLPMGHLPHPEHNPWSTHLLGMWLAYVLSAIFVAHFVGRVSRAIRDRDRRLAEVANLAAQNERLATLSSFSANAAHELGSPLATIVLAAKELSAGLQRIPTSAPLVADAELVCREVARCRAILADLSARAGESVGEMPVRMTPAQVVDELLRWMPAWRTTLLRIVYRDSASPGAAIVAPMKTLTQMLHNLIRNAFDAQEDLHGEAVVELHIEAGERLCFRVLDRGPGLTPEVRARLGEPFVTSKVDQGGLGLGVYLARAFAERTGGHLVFHERSGGGLEVELCLARDALRCET